MTTTHLKICENIMDDLVFFYTFYPFLPFWILGWKTYGKLKLHKNKNNIHFENKILENYSHNATVYLIRTRKNEIGIFFLPEKTIVRIFGSIRIYAALNITITIIFKHFELWILSNKFQFDYKWCLERITEIAGN